MSKDRIKIAPEMYEIMPPDAPIMLGYEKVKIDSVEFFSKNDRNLGGMLIKWSCVDIGFGELTVYNTLDSELLCDNEFMSQDFCEFVLLSLAKKWKLRD